MEYDFTFIDGLRWLPFIGNLYQSAKFKLLIVGESLYAAENENPEFLNSNPNLVTEKVNNWSLESWKHGVFPKNTMDVLNTNHTLWQGIAFMELIQEVMPTSKNRPTVDQFAQGLCTVLKVIDIIKPDLILFMGNRSITDANLKRIIKRWGMPIDKSCSWIEDPTKIRYHIRECHYNGFRLVALPHPSSRAMSGKEKRDLIYAEMARISPEVTEYINSLKRGQ